MSLDFSSAVVRMRVVAVRALQIERQGVLNGQLGAESLLRQCILTDNAQKLLAQSLDKLALSARAYHKILRLSRTLADMGSADRIDAPHIAEAISLRLLDRTRAQR